MSPLRTAAPHRRAGFTLVELLVAIAIGMALTVVVAQLFYHSRTTYTTTEDVSRMQENMRFAFQMLNRTVQLAGFHTAPNAEIDTVFTPATPVIVGVEGASGAPDSLTISYEGSGPAIGTADGTVTDCNGAAVAAGAIAVNVFTIAVDSNGQNALFCNGVAAVPDVDSMQILYGEDTDGDLAVNNYLNASQVTDMANVRSVRLALLFRTRSVNSAVAVDSTTTYDLHGTVLGPFNDRLIRRQMVSTIAMRNRLR
jgi:type IV pilus assembly protein PilW